MRTSHALVSASIAALLAAPLDAQPGALRVELDVGAGVALPTGYRTRGVGPVARGAITLSRDRRPIRLRGDAELAWFPDAATGPRVGTGTDRGALAVGSLVGALVVDPARGPVAPYVLVGGGASWLDVGGAAYPSRDAVVGLRVGAGLRLRVRGHAVRLEVAPHLVGSAYATGEDYALGSFIPVTLHARF